MLHRRHPLLGAGALPLAGTARAKGQLSLLAAADEAIE
jgi:hypothetical protein